MGYSDKAKKYKVSEWFDEWMKFYKIERTKFNTRYYELFYIKGCR